MKSCLDSVKKNGRKANLGKIGQFERGRRSIGENSVKKKTKRQQQTTAEKFLRESRRRVPHVRKTR